VRTDFGCTRSALFRPGRYSGLQTRSIHYNDPTHQHPTIDNMVTFERLASQTNFGLLPPELTKRIFDHAFAGRSPDVARCRLSCQHLHILTSPYLIRTVVVAERLDALRKLREVMLHPYFSQHVTHVIWDASYYDARIATEYNRYAEAVEYSKHLAASRDESYIRAQQADDKTLQAIERSLPTQPRIPASLRSTGQLLQYGVAPPTDDDRGVPLRSWRRSQPEDALSLPDMRVSNLYRRSDNDQEASHMRGSHLGFADYYRRRENQNSIRGKDWTFDCNQAREYFFEAFDRLPNLRNLAHTDFRALAYNGESYTHLCQRLFGHTVCPSFPYEEEAIEDYNGYYYNRFDKFLEDVATYIGGWASISFGRHPFETNYHDSSKNAGSSNVSLGFEPLWQKFFKDNMMPLDVRHLSLPILRSSHNSVKRFGGLYTIVTDSLVELELGDTRFYQYWDEHKGSTPPQPDDRSLARLWKLFRPSKSPLQNLHTLSLRGFVFSTMHLHNLLLLQLPALRTLHLIDSYCEDAYPHFSSLARTKIQQTTQLDGVEIFGLRFRRLANETPNHQRRQEYRDKMQERRAHGFKKYANREVQHFEGLLLSNWPYERPELEAAILGGQVNTVARKMHPAPNDEARWNWQDMPNAQTELMLA
jgi:hypothetical protein